MFRWIGWPLVSKRKYHAIRLENYTLRDALREANKEIIKHRRLLIEIRDGRVDLAAIVPERKDK